MSETLNAYNATVIHTVVDSLHDHDVLELFVNQYLKFQLHCLIKGFNILYNFIKYKNLVNRNCIRDI